MRVIAIVNQKGGCGKAISRLNLKTPPRGMEMLFEDSTVEPSSGDPGIALGFAGMDVLSISQNRLGGTPASAFEQQNHHSSGGFC